MNRKTTPAAGQESVWDYPRPPRLEECPHTRIRILADGLTIADTFLASRILETSHPPVYYIPISEIRNGSLLETGHRTWCEWKGEARYFSLVLPNKTIDDAGWVYPWPDSKFAGLSKRIAFYPSKMDACFVDNDRVTPQTGDFYGGWITPSIVGPFKGGPGTMGW